MIRTLFLSLFCFSSIASAKVEIEYAGNVIRYDINPRLSAVLHRLVLGTEFYWHTSSIYSYQDDTANKLKADTLELLSTIKGRTGVATAKMEALKSLESQINDWRVAARLPFQLDYDLIRIRDELNPKLEDGRYLLHLPFRVYTINVIGAVTQSKQIAHKNMTSVEGYLSDTTIQYLEYADTEFVYVIHPNGEVKKISLGLHNNEHVEVAPGGTIYIPLRELPFSEQNERLNKMVATVAGSRIQ